MWIVTKVVVPRTDFCGFFIVEYQPRADLYEVRNKGRNGTFHDRRVSQQNELVNHSDLKVLGCDCELQNFEQNNYKIKMFSGKLTH